MKDYNFNIASLLTEATAAHPDRLALICSHRPDSLGRTHLTYKDLDDSSSKLAAALIRGGFKPGGRVIVMIKPGPDFVITTFGLFKAGLAPVMVDPGMGLKRMFRCLAEGRPTGLAGIPIAHFLSMCTPKYFRHIKLRITIGRRWGWSGPTLLEILNSPLPGNLQIPAPTKASDTAAIMFTSGSTGPAKGVIYTHAMFKAQIDAIRDTLGITTGGVDLATFPLFGLFSPALGLTSVIPDMNPTKPIKADPQRLLNSIRQHGVTSMFASPALLNKISRFAHEHNLILPSLRRVVCAGAPVSPRTIGAFASLMSPEARLITPYGATEGVPLTYIDADEIARETRLMTEQGLGMCVGRPINGVKIAIIAIKEGPIKSFNDSLKLPMGEIGEITAQGPMISPAYFERDRDTSLAVIPGEDGTFWRRMGDVGWLDAEGRLWFCGRKNHRVVTGQGTLFSIPCEAVFNNHPQVRRSALVGVGKPGFKKPVIIVELHSKLKAPHWEALVEELTALAKANPRTISINTFLKRRSFPVDVRHNAKINREKLAVWASLKLDKKDFSGL